jgi:hypothetical protein
MVDTNTVIIVPLLVMLSSSVITVTSNQCTENTVMIVLSTFKIWACSSVFRAGVLSGRKQRRMPGRSVQILPCPPINDL